MYKNPNIANSWIPDTSGSGEGGEWRSLDSHAVVVAEIVRAVGGGRGGRRNPVGRLGGVKCKFCTERDPRSKCTTVLYTELYKTMKISQRSGFSRLERTFISKNYVIPMSGDSGRLPPRWREILTTFILRKSISRES